MKTLPIEDLLVWAYSDELPKAGAVRRIGPSGHDRGWRPVERFGDLLADVDCGVPMNRYGLAIDLMAEDGPHADAVALHEAVLALDDLVLDWPEDWAPLADIDDGDPLYAAAVARGRDLATRLQPDGRRILATRPSDLIRRQAILGGAPDTTAEKPARKVERANGSPLWFMRVRRPMPTVGGGTVMVEMEVDGFDRRRRAPYPQAYQRAYLDPDPAGVVVARAEYEVWRSGLDMVAATVALGHHRGLPSRWPARPWMDGAPAGPRVLMSRG